MIREATEADDAAICALIRRNAMPGAISLTMSHEPGFFASIEVEGCENRVLVSEADGKLAGVALVAKRPAHVDGRPTTIGYLGQLRLDRSRRNTRVLAEGFRFFNTMHSEDPAPPPFYLCSILEKNTFPLHKLRGNRSGLPQVRKIGALHTAAIPLIPRRKIRSKSVQITSGGDVGGERLIDFLNATGSKKQFFPVYSVRDLESPGGLLRGLSLDDFHVARSDGKILGVAACWDQSRFRRIEVASYSRGMRWAKAMLSPVFGAWNLPRLPEPGFPLRSVTAAGVAVEDDDPMVFRMLMNAMLGSQCGSGNTFLLVGLMESDPLLAEVKKYLHFPTRSSIFALSWKGLEAVERLDTRAQYLELGSL